MGPAGRDFFDKFCGNIIFFKEKAVPRVAIMVNPIS